MKASSTWGQIFKPRFLFLFFFLFSGALRLTLSGLFTARRRLTSLSAAALEQTPDTDLRTLFLFYCYFSSISSSSKLLDYSSPATLSRSPLTAHYLLPFHHRYLFLNSRHPRYLQSYTSLLVSLSNSILILTRCGTSTHHS